MLFKDVFVNRYNEARVGWRLLLFVAMLLSLRWGIMEILKAVGFRNEFAGLSLILAATLAVSYMLTRFVNKKPFGAIGLSLHPRMFREFGMGCLLGFLMMTGIFLIEFMSGFVQLSWKGASVLHVVQTIGWSLMFFAVAAFLEEALYRGYFFQTLMQWTSFLPAMLLLSIFFAAAHSRNPYATTFGLVNVGLAGIWLSIAYMKTRSLWLAFGLHASWNFSQTGLYSFPTSGLSFHDLRLFDRTQSGPEWITGGGFGPEGGVLATVALIACTWYILKSKYLQTPEGIVTLDSVEDLLPKPDIGEQSA